MYVTNDVCTQKGSLSLIPFPSLTHATSKFPQNQGVSRASGVRVDYYSWARSARWTGLTGHLMLDRLVTWPTAAAMFVLTTLAAAGPFKHIIDERKNKNLFLRNVNVDEEYKDVLMRLFTAISKPSRHTPSEAMTLFLQRKTYFQNIVTRFAKSHPKREPKFIHVAGSKGKGSTVEFIAAALRSNGHKVGVFTSPHLHTACERIKVGMDLISPNNFARLAQWALDEREHTCTWGVFFDLLLAMALRYFMEQQVNYVILETGIGGQFDSTNFVDEPVVTVITSISLDHQSILGDSIEEIAMQKAGIVKKGCPLVTPASQTPRALKVIRDVCGDLSAECCVTATDPSIVADLSLDVRADVMVENACLARAALEHIDESPVGMHRFFWPCRAEHFVVDNVTVVLDGAHNGDSVEQFLSDTRRRYSNSSLCVVFGGGKDKCLMDMLNLVSDKSDHVVMVQSSHFRSETEEVLVNSVPDSMRYKLIMQPPTVVQEGGTVASRLAESVAFAQKNVAGEMVVAVCGSLFVAAEAREAVYALNPGHFASTDWVHFKDKF